jgi:uncharacterized membrane protein (UPF0127 family)
MANMTHAVDLQIFLMCRCALTTGFCSTVALKSVAGVTCLARVSGLLAILLLYFPPNLSAGESLLVVRADAVVVRLTVVVADNAEAQRRGLMWRQDLAPRDGMLFDFLQPKDIAMWMKNTPISLDLLFIAQAGEVVYIKHRAAPHSLDLITAGQEVRYVLEINGGEAEELNFAIGDRIFWPYPAAERIAE